MAYVKTLFKTNFLEYASYVIKDRAIPHIDDGLKPVQRRILHSLFEMDDGKFHKVANVVGHSMKYHPHGDASIYSALVVLANKDIFIDKQGNFGNLYTGDEASAARYIECRVTSFAKNLLYKPEITAYEPSYDGRNKEPVVFPAKIPTVIVLGAEGIAVGMSTKILPHNLREVLEAVRSALRGKIPKLYPDFPQGGLMDASEYEDGLGKVLVRARIEESKDKKNLIIKELPFGTTTESLITSIENAAKKKKIQISSINDYTSENVEIEIKLPRGVYSSDLIDALYAFTDCEQSISVNLLVIRDSKPTIMTVTEVIAYHAKQLVKILEQELKLEQGKLKDTLHARTLERIFIEERIYKKIEDKKSAEGVKNAVFKGLEPFHEEIKREVTEEDIERLLKIPIRRISLYDINRAKKEIEEILARLKEIAHHLKNKTEYAEMYIDGLLERSESQGERKTKIISFEKTDVREAAVRNLKLRYDGETGYLGHSLSTGKSLFDVSQYDRVLIIRKTGAYSVVDVPEKLFVDTQMQYCVLAEKEELSQITFTVFYILEGLVYIKRCKIEQFIIGKGYSLIPDRAKFLKLTTKEEGTIVLNYKPKPRMKVLEEKFRIEDFLVKGIKASGVRMSSKQVKSMKVTK
jgi:topoisomerase-4 subunit A